MVFPRFRGVFHPHDYGDPVHSPMPRTRHADKSERSARRYAEVGRRSRERIDESSQGSSTARSRGNPDIKRRPFGLSNGAYGVSCRARAMRYATIVVAIRPRNRNGCFGSPVPTPRGAKDSARTGGNLTGPFARCITSEDVNIDVFFGRLSRQSTCRTARVAGHHAGTLQACQQEFCSWYPAFNERNDDVLAQTAEGAFARNAGKTVPSRPRAVATQKFIWSK
jgi:hypothetical protein